MGVKPPFQQGCSLPFGCGGQLPLILMILDRFFLASSDHLTTPFNPLFQGIAPFLDGGVLPRLE